MTELPPTTSRPAAPVSREWLQLRNPADRRARGEAAARMADVLAGFLRRRRGARPARLIDVGAGSGAGAAWLRARLPILQQWRLVDYDAALLVAAPPVVWGWARPVVADLATVADLLADEPADALTCQALLDLLDSDGIRGLLAPGIASGAAVLAALTVTGEVCITPWHPGDALVAAAFNAHQRRDGRLGPDAAGLTAGILQDAGYQIMSACTVWRLGPFDSGLMDAWLRGRARAAAEQASPQAARIGGWLNDRLTQLQTGQLSAVVDHVDLLGIPPA